MPSSRLFPGTRPRLCKTSYSPTAILPDPNRVPAADSRGRARFPVFARCPVVISAYSQTIASRRKIRTGTASFIRRGGRLPRLHRRGPFEDSLRALATKTRMGRHVWSLVAQAPGRKGAFAPDSSEPRRVDTKPLTTGALLPAWATRQGIGLSHRGDLG